MFALNGLYIVLVAQQDLFHYTFNITAALSFFVSSIGVFAYSNNKTIFNQQFWVNYFYVFGLLIVFYNFHCFQEHGTPDVVESLVNSFINIGVKALMTLYVLYRYAFIKNSF